MPYTIRKLPGKKLYRVRNKHTGVINATHTTLRNAQAQVRLLESRAGESKKKVKQNGL